MLVEKYEEGPGGNFRNEWTKTLDVCGVQLDTVFTAGIRTRRSKGQLLGLTENGMVLGVTLISKPARRVWRIARI
jgi:hypothetical protein